MSISVENGARRIHREKRTLRAMVEMFCRGRHGSAPTLCLACQDLADYALRRLDLCRLAPDKPTCAQCRIHCYKPEMGERVRAVMRYAGPRMLFRHPVLALMHQFDALVSRSWSVFGSRAATRP